MHGEHKLPQYFARNPEGKTYMSVENNMRRLLGKLGMRMRTGFACLE
jgi:hypothetical protein